MRLVHIYKGEPDMSDRFHNPEETTFDLISRLRREARQGSHPESNHADKESGTYKVYGYDPASPKPKPWTKINKPKGSKPRKKPSYTYRSAKKAKDSKRILGFKMSTIAMSAGGLILLAVLSFGLTTLFTNVFGGSPAAASVNADVTPTPYPLEDEAYIPLEEYAYPAEDYPLYEEYENVYEDEADIFNMPFTRLNVEYVIRPRLQELRYHMGLDFDDYRWNDIVYEVTSTTFDTYSDWDFVGIDWRSMILSFAEDTFVSSEWAIVLSDAPEIIEDEPVQTEQPSPTPISTPTPRQQASTVRITLSHNGLGVLIVDNQTLIDLFVRDYQLRLAINSPGDFPFSEHAISYWASAITRLYNEEGFTRAESRLQENIAALERAEIEMNNPLSRGDETPPIGEFYAVNLNHFTPAGVDFTLPVLQLRSRAVRDWFERNFEMMLHLSTPPHYLTGNHEPWFLLEAHVNNLSEDNAIAFLIARSVNMARQHGWTEASESNFQ